MNGRLKKDRLIVGVDEAGRGPLAGPVTVASFASNPKNRPIILRVLGGEIKDSKKLSPAKRKQIYKNFLILKKENKISFSCSHISHKVVDKKGISHAVRKGIEKCLKDSSINAAVRLDGLLKAPEKFIKQKTIIGGDENDLWIACASIVAKVRRDALLIRLAKKYPTYKFEIHKGYGTKLHRDLIRQNGLSIVHRVSFCRQFTN